ncbi:hypothetical protein ACFVTX_05740 [Agromyces sp. NPDC058136]|uniref:hypothetical protein n=1 Tax=Agromyces sp. NPDC058136 TaxID=3346354 RepID=UPI0036DCC548
MSTTPPEHGAPVPNREPAEQAAPTMPPPLARPNIHVSALIVWLTIFPLVAIVGMVSEPLVTGWHPVLRALVLTLIVVPIAAYWVMPLMFKGYAALERRRATRRAEKRGA